MAACIYAQQAEEAYSIDPIYGGDWGGETPIKLMLCCWAIYAPESVDALAVMPQWMVRRALAGEPIMSATCEKCAGRKEVP